MKNTKIILINNDCIGFEINKEYYEISKKRCGI